MSIRLDVNEYCDDCPCFKPHVETCLIERPDGFKVGVTTITCTESPKCEHISKYIRKSIEEEYII